MFYLGFLVWGEAVRCASTEESRGVRGHPPLENIEFYIARDAI